MVFQFSVQNNLVIEHSNSCWICDFTCLDVLVAEQNGSVVGRPWLTLVIDVYSRCVMGFHLGLEQPNAQVALQALRHAILPKYYDSQYNLHCEWATYGIPEHLYIDGGRSFSLHEIQSKALQLRIVVEELQQVDELQQLSLKSAIERCFSTFNRELFSYLPGYVVSNLQIGGGEAAANTVVLLLKDLEEILVRYIVENYNQQIDPRFPNHTRQQRWEAGLSSSPQIIQEQELDF
jgi:putative transposase